MDQSSFKIYKIQSLTFFSLFVFNDQTLNVGRCQYLCHVSANFLCKVQKTLIISTIWWKTCCNVVPRQRTRGPLTFHSPQRNNLHFMVSGISRYLNLKCCYQKTAGSEHPSFSAVRMSCGVLPKLLRTESFFTTELRPYVIL